MKNSLVKNSVIILSLAAVLVILYYFFNKQSWERTYKSEEKNPYDTFLIHELLFEKFDKKFNRDYKLISDSSIKEFNRGNLNYVFIGKQLFQIGQERS